MYDPEAMFHALETAAEERAAAEQDAHLLERQGEVLLAQLMCEAKQSGEPIGICKEMARNSDVWRRHIEGESVAIGRRSRARAKYNNLTILAEARRTEAVTTRALTK